MQGGRAVTVGKQPRCDRKSPLRVRVVPHIVTVPTYAGALAEPVGGLSCLPRAQVHKADSHQRQHHPELVGVFPVQPEGDLRDRVAPSGFAQGVQDGSEVSRRIRDGPDIARVPGRQIPASSRARASRMSP